MVWGQKQGEGMQPLNPGQRHSSSQRGCLPRRDTRPIPPFPSSSPLLTAALPGWGGPAALPPCPAPLALRLPPAAPWAGGGCGCSAALRLSSARGRERELFVPVACRTPGLANPGCTGARGSSVTTATGNADATGSGDWDSWERTARPFARRRHPPAHGGLLSPWHVPSPRSVAARGWLCPPLPWWEPGAGAELGRPPASC